MRGAKVWISNPCIWISLLHLSSSLCMGSRHVGLFKPMNANPVLVAPGLQPRSKSDVR